MLVAILLIIINIYIFINTKEPHNFKVVKERYRILREHIEKNGPEEFKVLENEKILKIGHFLRFDKNALEFFLKCKIKNIFDTKIASKIVRTYTDSHGLKNLVQEFCNKTIDKRFGSSDWNKDIEKLSDKQLEYAANDVIYLHKIKTELEKMLIREKRLDIFNKCLTFLDTRVTLDQKGFKFDIFEH